MAGCSCGLRMYWTFHNCMSSIPGFGISILSEQFILFLSFVCVDKNTHKFDDILEIVLLIWKREAQQWSSKLLQLLLQLYYRQFTFYLNNSNSCNFVLVFFVWAAIYFVSHQLIDEFCYKIALSFVHLGGYYSVNTDNTKV